MSTVEKERDLHSDDFLPILLSSERWDSPFSMQPNARKGVISGIMACMDNRLYTFVRKQQQTRKLFVSFCSERACEPTFC
jgi:hypothetical protein